MMTDTALMARGMEAGTGEVPGESMEAGTGEVPGESEIDIEPVARALESILFVSGGPVTVTQLAEAVEAPREVVLTALAHLVSFYAGRGLQIQPVAGGYQMTTDATSAEAVRRFLGAAGREPLTQAALEVLAIVAYRQPVTRPEIEAVRGVRCDHVLERLEARNLIRVSGRKTAPGRPLLYATTDAFLRYFGLRDLSALPDLRPFPPAEVTGAR